MELDLEAKLQEIGVPPEDMDEVIKGVSEIIIRRAFDAKIKLVDPKMQEDIERLAQDPDAVNAYIVEHKDSLRITEEDIAPIAEKTWQEYFDAMAAA